MSIQDNTKLLEQVDSGFERKVIWNKYFIPKPELLKKIPNFNHLVEPSFKRVNRLFVENDAQRTSHSGYYIPNVELKTYNVVIDGKKFFDQPVKDIKVTYEKSIKITTGQEDHYTTDCLLDYPYFKDNYKIIVVDLSKQNDLSKS